MPEFGLLQEVAQGDDVFARDLLALGPAPGPKLIQLLEHVLLYLPIEPGQHLAALALGQIDQLQREDKIGLAGLRTFGHYLEDVPEGVRVIRARLLREVLHACDVARRRADAAAELGARLRVQVIVDRIDAPQILVTFVLELLDSGFVDRALACRHVGLFAEQPVDVLLLALGLINHLGDIHPGVVVVDQFPRRAHMRLDPGRLDPAVGIGVAAAEVFRDAREFGFGGRVVGDHEIGSGVEIAGVHLHRAAAAPAHLERDGLTVGSLDPLDVLERDRPAVLAPDQKIRIRADTPLAGIRCRSLQIELVVVQTADRLARDPKILALMPEHRLLVLTVRQIANAGYAIPVLLGNAAQRVQVVDVFQQYRLVVRVAQVGGGTPDRVG